MNPGTVVLGLALVQLLACTKPSALKRADTNGARPEVESNVLRSDYVGSEACRDCHRELYARFVQSPMHRMTRDVEGAEVRAPFTGSSFRLRNDTATMEQRAGTRFMRLRTDELGERLYRVTRIIGGRYREDFVGLDVTGDADPIGGKGHGAERVLPVSYVFSTQSWRYKGYSVMVPERPALRPGAEWAATCIGCHNTLPAITLLYDELHGEGAPSYQGSVASHLVPDDKAWTRVIHEPDALRAEVVKELGQLSANSGAARGLSLQDTLHTAMRLTQRKLEGKHLVEVGIGCEACHGGAREHVENTHVRPSFAAKSALFSLRPKHASTARDVAWLNRACMRCHTVLFSRYPWTWEGGRRRDRVPGGSSTNSGEARDFLLGGCASELTCTTCHDPHAEDSAAQLAYLQSPQGKSVCVTCHSELTSDAAVTAHTHHARDSQGSACLSCHMSKKNTALDYRLTRYHRIGSPTDEARVLGDRPLECALCHEDKSVGELVTTMERWWDKRYDRGRLAQLYGPLDANALRSTLVRGKAHEQAAAIMALGEQRAGSALPQLAPHLTHAYPLLRGFTKQAIEQITGESLPVDVTGTADEITPQVERWLRGRADDGG